MNSERHSDEPTRLDAHQEAELDALLARLRAGRDSEDPLAGFVDAARAHDVADVHAIEACVDATYEEYAVATERVGALEFLAVRLRHSPLMRLVAASIVAHLLVLPVLAYAVLTPEPEPPYTLVFELPADRAPVVDAPRDALLELEAEDLLGPRDGDAPNDGLESPSSGENGGGEERSDADGTGDDGAAGTDDADVDRRNGE